MPLNIPLDHRDEEQKRDDYNDGCAEFDSLIEDKVDVITKLYKSIKAIPEEDMTKKLHDALIAAVVCGCQYLRNEMDDLWNGDIPGGCHTEPDSDYYVELNDIIKTEEE